MKNAKKSLAILMSIVLLLCAMPLMQASAENEYYESGPWEYTVENGEATIEGFYPEDDLFGKVSVPSTLGGYPVTGIEWISCYNSEIDLYIPASITRLAGDPYDRHFAGGILSITVDENNPAFSSENGVLFNKDKTELIRYPEGSEKTSYTIPDSVTTVGYRAFYNCWSLTSITIPNSVTDIYKGAFSSCGITSTIIPDGITNIADSAFYNCCYLTSITIPDSVTSIGNNAFDYCESFETIKLPDNITAIGDYAFYGCYKLTRITLPESLLSIGEYAFYGCNNLTEITIPAKVASIGGAAFCSCDSLSAITVDKNNLCYSNDEYGVLFNKDKTQLVQCPVSKEQYTIPDSVTEIGVFAFMGCDKLTNVTLPDGLKSIGDCAFVFCTNLTQITLPHSLTAIGDSAFECCGKLASITIPDSVTDIGDYAFGWCGNLTNVIISDGITKISKGMFDGCSELISVQMPDSITVIGAHAFNDCNKLINVNFPADIEVLEPYALAGTVIEELYIPASIETIDYNAFNYSNLDDIYFEGNRTQWNNAITAMYPDDYYYDYENLFLDSVNVHFNHTLEPASGSCGANATWEYNGMGTLTVSGTGTMASYPSGQVAPWNNVADKITKLEIKEGITSIDGFYNLENVETLILPESLKYIESCTFGWSNHSDYYEQNMFPETIIYKGMPEQWKAIKKGAHDNSDYCYCYDFYNIIYIDNEDFEIDSIDIIVNGSTTVKYGEITYIYAGIPMVETEYNTNYFLPVGTQLSWYVDNGEYFIGNIFEEYACSMTSKTSGTEILTVCLEDENGYTIYNDNDEPIEASIELTSKAGIFEILAYIFRSFFDMLLSLFMF